MEGDEKMCTSVVNTDNQRGRCVAGTCQRVPLILLSNMRYRILYSMVGKKLNQKKTPPIVTIWLTVLLTRLDSLGASKDVVAGGNL